MFGVGRPRALDRNAKARIMHLAKCLSRRTEKDHGKDSCEILTHGRASVSRA
jgi:hypothetical protein